MSNKENESNSETEKDARWQEVERVRDLHFESLFLKVNAHLTEKGEQSFKNKLAKLARQSELKLRPLEEMVEQITDKYKKERSQLVNERQNIKADFEHWVGVDSDRTRKWHTVFPRVYFKDIDFGFCFEDAFLILRYAFDHQLSADFMLTNFNKTRQALQEPFGRGSSDSRTKNFFTERENEEYPITIEIEEQFQFGLYKLRSLFVNQRPISDRNLDRNRSGEFFMAKALFQSIDDPKLPKRNLAAISALFEFMQTDLVDIFRGPVIQKYKYEEQFKDSQRQNPKEPLSLGIDHSEEARKAIQLLSLANLPFTTFPGDGVFLLAFKEHFASRNIYNVVNDLVPGFMDVWNND